MSQWKHSLNVSDVWDHPNTGYIAETIANRIEKKFLPKYNDELLCIVLELRDVKHIYEDEGNAGAQEVFNTIWEDFYNWADTRLDQGTKMCWIQTV